MHRYIVKNRHGELSLMLWIMVAPIPFWGVGGVVV
jgi:hypothetical protein